MPKQKKPATPDPQHELAAMRAAYDVLAGLGVVARNRAIVWLQSALQAQGPWNEEPPF